MGKTPQLSVLYCKGFPWDALHDGTYHGIPWGVVENTVETRLFNLRVVRFGDDLLEISVGRCYTHYYTMNNRGG